MTRFRFRGHQRVNDAINKLKKKTRDYSIYGDSKREQEEGERYEKEREKKKEVKEDLEEGLGTRMSPGSMIGLPGKVRWKEKMTPEKIKEWEKASGEKYVGKVHIEKKKDVKEGKEENEAREKARRDKNVKKWKQNTDRWSKWKAEQKEGKAKGDLERKLAKARADLVKRTPVKEEKISLPDKYEGDHSVRRIYDEGLTYRGSGGRQMQMSAGRVAHGGAGGLYGSVADSPVRSTRSAIARPDARAISKPAVSAPQRAPRPQAQAPKPIVGQSNIPAQNVSSGPKHPAATPPGKGSSKGQLFNYAKSGGASNSGGLTDPKSAHASGITPRHEKAAVVTPKAAIQSTPTSKPTGFAARMPVPHVAQAPSPKPPVVNKVVSAGVSIPSTSPGAAKKDVPPTTGFAARMPVPHIAKFAPPPSTVSLVAPNTTKKDVMPNITASPVSPQMKSTQTMSSIPSNEPMNCIPGTSSTPSSMDKLKAVTGRARPLLQGEEKISLPDKYEGDHSVRKLYGDKISEFVWKNEPKKEMKTLKKSPEPEVVKETDDYINLTKDGMLKVKRSQYIEDMLGDKDADFINKKEEFIKKDNNYAYVGKH